MLHHPSYQEQNNNATNRRRRRRPPTQAPNLVNKEKEETPVPSKPVTNVAVKETEENKESSNENRRERVPRHLRREDAPVERVSVEMTPTEQNVYALMGISPLVRVDQEFKDPKSVLVSVKSPEGFERKKLKKLLKRANKQRQQPLAKSK
ncbi:Ribonuclease E [Crocosphaera watsonii WH 0005]|uniref:Ribonuclease E n=1 Tax=Crocosphaera watsonii WH 0005 TaxID=423472 RepID=T2IR74_CROWT|nr:Ribonuclease E [Crocosphaera watsonii WH 0005]